MKILSLDLIAFGPFTNHRLDLSGGNEGLHLIHGPNEAGKSSTLRALSDFLFGIHNQSPDDFVHEYSAMRIGATLRDRDGKALSLVRLKRRGAASLETPDGKPADDAALGRVLAGLTKETFERQYRFDHERLVAGGRTILEKDGELGRLLFEAGSGVTLFREALGALEQEWSQLFKPSGKNPSINAALARLKEVRQTRKADALPPTAWAEIEAGKTKAESELNSLLTEIGKLTREQRDRERVRRLLPLAARRRETLARLEARSGVRPLSADFSDRRVKARHELPTAEAARKAALDEIAAIDSGLGELPAPDALLDARDDIERLRDERRQYLNAKAALPKLVADAATIEGRVASLIEELAPGPEADATELSPPPPHAKKAVESLKNEYIRLTAEHEKARADVDLFDDTDGIEDLADDADELRVRANRWRAHAKLDDELARRRAALKGAEDRAEASLRRLPYWTSGLAELISLRVPSLETILARIEEFAERDKALKSGEAKIEEIDEEIAALDREAERDRVGGGIPTEAELDQARGERNRLWTKLRDRGAEPSDPSLVVEYEGLVASCDSIADRLRREADRVAVEVRRTSERRSKAERRETVAARMAKLRSEAESALASWTALWATAGIEPGTPREMEGWYKKREELLETAEEADRLRAEFDSETAARNRIADEIRASLARFGRSTSETEDSLPALLDRVESLLTRVDRGRAFAAARKRLEKAQDALVAWNERWRASLVGLGLARDLAPDDVATHFDRLAELAQHRRELASLEQQARATRMVVDAFAELVRVPVRRYAPELAELTPDEAAPRLIERFQRAETADRRRRELLEKREESVARLKQAEVDRDSAATALEQLREEAGGEDLAAAEAAWREVRALSEELAGIDRALLDSGEGASIEELLTELLAENSENVQNRLDEIRRELAPLEGRRDELNQEIGRLRADLARHDGTSKAAEAEEEAQAILARVGTEAASYARLKLGSALLKSAMDRYREKNTATILSRASDFFARLTLGSFERLILGDEGQLLCVRAAGKSVPMTGLSEGTADALYLALRLAALHSDLDRHEPIPFVVDDILVNLDEQRTTAALEILAELSDRTQVLLFTHHAHVVESATAGLEEGRRLFVHALPGRFGFGRG